MLPPVAQPRRSRRRGTALVVTIIFLLLLAATAGTVATVTRSQSLASTEHQSLGEALLVADNGLAKARVLLERDLTTGSEYSSADLDVAQQILAEDGATVTVTRIAESAGGREHTFRLRSVGTTRQQRRTAEVIILLEEPTPSTMSGPGLGAVVANGDVKLGGNITIDGNDYLADNSGLNALGQDVASVTATGTTNVGGSSRVGGGGVPVPDGKGGAVEDVTIDNDTNAWAPEGSGSGGTGDVAHDTNGLDDDGDGYVDEDGFPDRPGQLFGLSDEAGLKAAARATNTYFTSAADYNAWVSNTSQQDAGGKIVFIEVDAGTKVGRFDLPDNPASSGAAPTLIIVVGLDDDDDDDEPTLDTELGPVHVEDGGTFQGVLVCDTIKNMNSTGTIVGSVVCFNQATVHNLGNGNITVRFSSQVVNGLPGVDPATGSSPPPTLLMWRELR